MTRSFCLFDDLIDGLMRLMESPAAFTGPVNLGNPSESRCGARRLVLAETPVLHRACHAALAAG